MDGHHPLLRHSARIRAALIALLIFSQAVVAFPLPMPIRESDLRDPIVRQEIQRWSEILQVPRPELERALVQITPAAHQAQQAVLRPFGPLFRLTGTGQSWGLFTFPNTWPHRLIIDASADGESFEVLFRANDPEHDWLGPQLRERHVRGVFDDNATRVRPTYDNFVDWVARRAFSERAELQVVRVYMERFRAGPPGEVEPAEPTRRLLRKRTRVEVMP